MWMRSLVGRWSWPSDAERDRLVHALKTAIALVLAVGVCMRLELPQPRTAMLSAIILMGSQQSGMVIARGFYRFLGLFGGCVAGLVLVALFAQASTPFFVGLACWIGICVWGAAYYRNYQSYGFVLAGFSTAITAVPVWQSPYGIFDNVIYTLSEVSIGVVSSSLVSALIFPKGAIEALLLAGRRHVASLITFARRLTGSELSQADLYGLHLALIGERANIEALRTAAVFEDPALRLSNPRMIRLNQRFLDTNASFHAVRRIRERIERVDVDAIPLVQPFFDDFLSMLPQLSPGQDFSPEQARALSVALNTFRSTLIHRLKAMINAMPNVSSSLRQDVVGAPSQLYFATENLAAYLSDFADLRDILQARPPRGTTPVRPARSFSTANHLAAMVAGLRAIVAICSVASLWVLSGWDGGANALIGVSIGSALFAIAPKPAVASEQAFRGCLVGGLIAVCLTYVFFPRIDGFPLLALAISPPLMFGAYLSQRPSTAVFGLTMSIYFCFVLNLTNPTVFALEPFLDSFLAFLLGIGVAALAFAVLAPHGGAWLTRAYLRQVRRLTSRTISSRHFDDDALPRFESGLRDFVIHIAADPGTSASDRQRLLGWAFAALEGGRTVIQVCESAERHHGGWLPSGWTALQAALQAALAALFDEVTPQRHARALDATRAAIQALPAWDAHAQETPDTIDKLRIRAQLRSAELLLLDPSLPLNPAWTATS